MGSKKTQTTIPASPLDMAEMAVLIAESNYRMESARVVNEAKSAIERLKYAIRDITQRIEQYEMTEEQAKGFDSATPANIREEAIRRLSYVVSGTSEAVLTQVGNMGLGYMGRYLLDADRARVQLDKAQEELAALLPSSPVEGQAE